MAGKWTRAPEYDWTWAYGPMRLRRVGRAHRLSHQIGRRGDDGVVKIVGIVTCVEFHAFDKAKAKAENLYLG